MPEFILDRGPPSAARSFATLDSFAQGYIEALFFTNANDRDDECDGLSFADLAPATLADIIADCASFQDIHSDLLAEATSRDDYSAEQAGRDLWFTRCGHGVGFWDRDQLAADGLGDRLAAFCGHGTDYPNRDVYKGDDGKIHLS